MKNVDILDSQIKKVRIELPHYSFNHSSSEESSHFVGREKIREKLKKIIEASNDKTGVYLVAGNRGVGKTSLVNKVINETSLRDNSKFSQTLKFLLILLIAVAGTQFCLQTCLQEFELLILYVFGIAFIISSILLCFFNGYRLKSSKEKGFWKSCSFFVISAIKEFFTLLNPYNPYKSSQYVLKIILVVGFTQIFSTIFSTNPTIIFLVGYSGGVFLHFVIVKVWKYYYKCKKMVEDLQKIKNAVNTTEYREKCIEKIIGEISKFFKIPLIPFWKYIKNHRRLYLHINFGHKLKDEKDILRLIARTLSTEYNQYLRSFGRMLPWRAIALGFLLLSACLFSSIVKNQEFYKTIQKNNSHQADSQICLKDSMNINDAACYQRQCLRHDSLGSSKRSYNVKKISLRVCDDIVLEISKCVEKVSQCFLKVDISKSMIQKFIFSLNYLFGLSFILIYLLCVLLFRCNWIMHFFVTHRIIKRQLKRLNSDITHSTERENTVNIKGEGIGTRTKRIRGVADAREIEKELQDILNNIQRIPVFMCRPDIVIVFDELDKVEPDDVKLEKETQKTKASLFSMDTTREKQTEILKILSNMKYFLSTANAKFIFIAGREMYDIYLADVSERSNYIGSIFNTVIYVPSFLTDHADRDHPNITLLTEEFVCRKIIPHDYRVESYDLKSYRNYLEKGVYNDANTNDDTKERIQKIIAVLQQLIIYLAHVSKGAPKKMMQLFESFIEVCKITKDDDDRFLVVQRYHNSKFFLTFNYYQQFILGIIAYLITPIFNHLSESNIKERSDKLLVSSLRFVDFLFKFHKHPFSWRHIDISPEMLEVNRSPALKSVAMDLLNYLAQIHINRSNFSFSDYKFDDLIASEIFAMIKTDNVFSALFSFSLDETLSLKKHYQDQLERTQKEYQQDKGSLAYINAVSSLQVVLGDLHYYDDELEEAGVYYKNVVQALSNLKSENDDKKEDGGEAMTLEQHYLYVRNMLRLGMIYERRKQYDFAYLTYGELCKRIIRERDISVTSPRPLYFKDISPDRNDMLFKKMTYEGLRMLYLPFIAKFQILEKSHVGGITPNHLEQLEKEFTFLTDIIDHEEAKLLEAEFYSRLADILYYKNLDLKNKNRQENNNENGSNSDDGSNDIKNYSCTACHYYNKALSMLLEKENKNENTVIDLLYASVKQLNKNYNMKYCTILARILSDWGNIFFSCDKQINNGKSEYGWCCICNANDCNTWSWRYIDLESILKKYIDYVESESKYENCEALLNAFESSDNLSKMEIAFAMYAISLKAYTKSNLYKRSSYQIFKMLSLFKYYGIYDEEYIEKLSQKAIRSLWHANEELNMPEIKKRKTDFDEHKINGNIPLRNILVDSEIHRICILVKELELKNSKTIEKLNECYGLYITSPYGIIYSITTRIYQLRLKTAINYEAYQIIKPISDEKECINTINKIFNNVDENRKINILKQLIAETIFCLKEIIRLSKTIGETYLFNHSFMGSIHEKLVFWIRLYKIWKRRYEKKYKKEFGISEYFEKYLGKNWEEQLSSYYEKEQALSRYYKCLEMHNEGRAYHNIIDNMCYIKDDYNDRSDHFSIAEERHNILNGKIDKKIEQLKRLYENSRLYEVDNYYNTH